jgi:hypothetical protein
MEPIPMHDLPHAIEQGSSSTESGASFWIQDGARLAVAEVSAIPKSLAFEYIGMSDLNDTDKQKLTSIIEASDAVFFFNRLNVPKQIENKGHGAALLKQVAQYMDDHNGFLINTASAYGNKTQDDLIAYYQRHGMELISSEGLLVYHKTLSKIEPSRARIQP